VTTSQSQKEDLFRLFTTLRLILLSLSCAGAYGRYLAYGVSHGSMQILTNGLSGYQCLKKPQALTKESVRPDFYTKR
jgi:hypothetical protein